MTPVTPGDPDQSVENHIDALVDREHELRRHAEGHGLTADETAELHDLEVRLDQLWDLLRRRRAARGAGHDPSAEAVRDPDTVEGYEQ